jgi:hypothetical protein
MSLEPRIYLTDDSDQNQHTLQIQSGDNGDWYIAVLEKPTHKIGPYVRLTTSGCRSGMHHVAGAVANLYRAIGGEVPQYTVDVAALQDWRGIEDVCPTCGGGGWLMYPDTATWRRGRGTIAGRALTPGVCDKCWGSGDAAHPWVNLRQVEQRVKALKGALSEALDGWRSATYPVESCAIDRLRRVLEGGVE